MSLTIAVTILMPLMDLSALPEAVAFQMCKYCDSACKKMILYAREFVTGFFFFLFDFPFACLFWPDVYCTYFVMHIFITAYTITVLYTHSPAVLILSSTSWVCLQCQRCVQTLIFYLMIE